MRVIYVQCVMLQGLIDLKDVSSVKSVGGYLSLSGLFKMEST